MKIDDIYNQRRKRWNSLIKSRRESGGGRHECNSCKESFSYAELSDNLWICPQCGNYIAMPAMERIKSICDEDSFKEIYGNMTTSNPLDFPDYDNKLHINQVKTGQLDALIGGSAKIGGNSVIIAVLDSRFLMGSMGTVVGEKLARFADYAGKKKLPLIVFSASGGARMQEGLFSLMQMAATSGAVQSFKDNGGLFISCLTNPTTGGVSASFASLGDIMIAEPGALICFAGPRVIKQTIGQTLPEGFQHAEFLLEHGMLDMIVDRKDMRERLSDLIRLHVRK